MKEQEKARRKKAGIITAIALVLVLAAALAGLLFAEPGSEGSAAEPLPENAAWTAAGCVLTGDSFELTQGQLCTVLTSQLQKTPVSWLDAGNLRVQTAADQKLILDAPATWNGMRFHLTAVFTVAPDARDKRLAAELTDVRVGYLPIPPGWALSRLSESLPDGVEAEGTTLSVPCELPLLLLGEDQTLAALEVTRVSLEPERIAFSFAVNADGASELLQEGLDWLQGLFG